MVVRAAAVAMLTTYLATFSCDGRSLRNGSSSRAGPAAASSGADGGRTGASGASGATTGAHGGAPADGVAGESGAAQAGGATAGSSGETAGASGSSGIGGAGRSAGGGGAGDLGGGGADGGELAGGVPGTEAGGADEGGRGGATGEFPPRQSCGTTYPPNAVKCYGLGQIAISAGPILDADGNEGVSPGEDAAVVLTLHNTADEIFDAPCVGLLADDPAVEEIHGDTIGHNPWPKYFGILPDQSLDFKARFHLDDGVTPATVIHFVAWVTLQTAGCVNGQEISFTLSVEP